MKINFTYGNVFGEPSDLFREDIFKKLKIKPAFKKKDVLDLGCGFGLDSMEFAKVANRVVAADAINYKSWGKIDNKKIKFIRTFSEKLPFKDNQFSAVYMKDLLHHVNDVDKTLDEVRRVSKKGAIIFILEGNRYNPLFYFLVTKLKGHEHFSQREFKKIILKHFPNSTFKSFESYPPFFLNKFMFKILLKIENLINKISLLKSIYSYNLAIIKVKK